MAEPPGERLDIRVARLLNVSREEAQRIIKGGYVTLAGRQLTKPGERTAPGAAISVSGGRRPFVSRGGEKLEAALTRFSIDLTGKICLDIGASTGGFTDCMLKRRAARVYAVENGTNQMAGVLRGDSRVILYEQQDIRRATPEMFSGTLLFAAADVSFIPLRLILEPIYTLLAGGADLVCLVKPQYEAGPGHVNKHGVVKNDTIRQKAVDGVVAYASTLPLVKRGIIPSPVDSANREYLVHFYKPH